MGLRRSHWQARADFDLLLLDIHMPEMDGFQVVKAIRERETDYRKTSPRDRPYGAHRAKKTARLCLAAGMDDFLVKPLRATELCQALDRLAGIAAPAENFELRSEPEVGSLLSPDVLLSSCGGDEQMLAKICESFRRHVPQQLSAIKDAAKKTMHRICARPPISWPGLWRHFRLRPLSCASEVEDLAAANRINEFRGAVALLEETTEKLLQELDELSIAHLQKQASAPPG